MFFHPKNAVLSGGALGSDGRECVEVDRGLQIVCGPCQHGKVNPLAWLIACVRASNIFILAGQSSEGKIKTHEIHARLHVEGVSVKNASCGGAKREEVPFYCLKKKLWNSLCLDQNALCL